MKVMEWLRRPSGILWFSRFTSIFYLAAAVVLLVVIAVTDRLLEVFLFGLLFATWGLIPFLTDLLRSENEEP